MNNSHIIKYYAYLTWLAYRKGLIKYQAYFLSLYEKEKRYDGKLHGIDKIIHG